jgi:biopolymer transport protein ExbD
MSIKIKRESLSDKIPIDMTPMIDIVFQLLTFFIMTLKIASVEGDFNIKMPLAAPRAGDPDPNALVLNLYMTANASGDCANLRVDDQSFNGPENQRWIQLHNYVASVVGEGSLAASAEVKIHADYDLKYENVIKAITAVSGKIEDGQIIKLVEKIQFAPPTQQ